MTRDDFLRNYWSYYMMLEEKFINTLNYVELSKDNENTFSNEYAGLIQLIGSEVDVVFKEYCDRSESERLSIEFYCNYVREDWPEIVDQELEVHRAESLTIQPFEGWRCDRPSQSLKWWEAYNNIKHGRVRNKKEASLKNGLYALGALYMLEMKKLKKIAEETNEIDIPDTKSSLFELKNWEYNFGLLSDYKTKLCNGVPVIDGGNASE